MIINISAEKALNNDNKYFQLRKHCIMIINIFSRESIVNKRRLKLHLAHFKTIFNVKNVLGMKKKTIRIVSFH